MGVQERIDAGNIELDLRPVAGRIGAEISGISLGGGLDDGTIAAIRAALLRYKVVFFRDQHHLSYAEQEAFAQRFGPLVPHPTLAKVEGTEAALRIDYADGRMAANEWHTDESFQDVLPLGAVLRAVTLPPLGGDTMWANTVGAYEHLPEPLRDLADRLWALHSNIFDADDAAKYHEEAPATGYVTEHPLVHVHPETGERALLLGYHVYHTQRIIGLSHADSALLIALYQGHITRPENVVRWHWAPGDVAFWDNRATQHYGIGDFTALRQMSRVGIDGEVPISIDGRRSVARRK